MSMFGLLLGLPPGDTHLVVGAERDEDGSVRVYLDRRWEGIHTHVTAGDRQGEQLLGGWSGHLFTDVPADALCDCTTTPPPNPSTTEGEQ